VPTATGIVTATNGVPTPGQAPFTPEGISTFVPTRSTPTDCTTVNGSPNAWPLLIRRANKPGKQNNFNGGKGNGNPNPGNGNPNPGNGNPNPGNGNPNPGNGNPNPGNGNPNPGTGNNNGGDPQSSLSEFFFTHLTAVQLTWFKPWILA
jgi:hypothetical protein